MDALHNLALGFASAGSLYNLFYCFVGCLLGTAVGVLPGLGPLATISLLLPLTFGLPPETSLIMLAGIYYGSQYGGSTTAILVNLPGEASSVVTALEGYKMARQGKAGLALATAAIASCFAGTIATFLLAIFAPPLGKLALTFGPADYFSLITLGLICSIILAHGSLLHALGMIMIGLLLGLVGTDVTSGIQRFTFGNQELFEGLDFVVVAMGFFGVGDIICNLEETTRRSTTTEKIGSLVPSKADMKRMFMPMLRGTMIGSMLGILPGGGALLSSFASYSTEKKLSKIPGEFGSGALAGVAGPEAANNAGAQMSFVPMLTLGLPSNPVMALMIGAMIIQGIQPGPGIMDSQPTLFWGLVASMWIGNLMLLILNLPLVGLWAKMVLIPYSMLFPAILLFCVIGVFSLSNSVFDVYLMALFGLVGYVFHKLKCEPAPLLLGFILGPMMEEYLRRALILSDGSLLVFVTRPVSCVLLIASAAMLISIILPSVRKTREVAFEEE
jgi:putative tricarboxylic transport membrane protein